VVVSFDQPFDEISWSYRNFPGVKGIHQSAFIGIDTTEKKALWNGSSLIYSFRVPAGEYEFYHWAQEAFGKSSYLHSTTPFSIRFHSVAGKATYIGHLHVPTSGQHFGLGISDLSADEVPLFLDRYRNFSPNDVEVHLMLRAEPTPE
jgi:hypothetical protein